ncbi:MAG: hypothetical protein KJ620_04975 [Candidatus Edwardsbacteria bacterium]|nr:hypothetical protein [Candidatus Edwardsbacteria bacterium]MBU1576544.1 hypothetical protein [Candidatus Edwardsbacteria bacterium]MBU2463747.1 hypothetical protein [Candidatus Edwardsbacteria bacterium]MBU2593677.1 hypothetical protein [Candidatus Edwardsbacteria bacterium]
MKLKIIFKIFVLLLIFANLGCAKKEYHLSHKIKIATNEFIPAAELILVKESDHFIYYNTLDGSVSNIPISNDSIKFGDYSYGFSIFRDSLILENDSIKLIWVVKK